MSAMPGSRKKIKKERINLHEGMDLPLLLPRSTLSMYLVAMSIELKASKYLWCSKANLLQDECTRK